MAGKRLLQCGCKLISGLNGNTRPVKTLRQRDKIRISKINKSGSTKLNLLFPLD